MVKLRFIKPWGTYKPGDLLESRNANTVHMLVNIYKFAVIEQDNPVATAEPSGVVTDVAVPKFIRQAPKDKMTRSSFNKTKRY